MPPRRRVSLQLKLVALLLLAVLVPLGASAYLIDSLGKVAANVAANEAQLRQAPMERALGAYRELIETTKRLHAEVASRLALDEPLTTQPTPAQIDAVLDREPGLLELAVLDAGGAVLAERTRPLPMGAWRRKGLEHPLASGGTLRLGFAVPSTLQDDILELKGAVDHARVLAAARTALPASYRRTFLALVGVAALVAVAIGVIAARRVTRRVAALVTTARAVGAGATDARVQLQGRDEMAELGAALDAMLDQIDASRRQVEYLQRIGAWQDVARRLAHEIKNPLTPIQLAVQQCVSAYARLADAGGGTEAERARFARSLADTGEIVEEEIAALRRLVDAFRTLGQLPKVAAAPLPLGELVEELRLDPTFAERLDLRPPSTPVTVRADKLLLKRVLVNLVENGVQAGQEHGHAGDVVVGWGPRAGGDVIELTVDDHGRGVAADARERVFEPYVTTKATGTGLGLAIAKKIMLEHGGDLRVDPAAAPTGGARFVITLPSA
ncbi:MAG: ATP-binding protein [Kofleriaceae bacterium]